jgi:hypothetical protein
MGQKIVIVVTDGSEEDVWDEVGEEGEGKLSRRPSVVGEGGWVSRWRGNWIWNSVECGVTVVGFEMDNEV